MALRVEKGIGALLIALFVSPAMFAQQSFEYKVWHGHSRPPHIRKAGNFGALVIDGTGVSFHEVYQGKQPKHQHAWRWKYDEIQQLKLEPHSLTVLTYKDTWWKVGADRQYEFDLDSEKSFEDAYSFLKSRLDQRFVAALAAVPATSLWEIPAKHLVRFGGDEGVLQVGVNEIAYKSGKKGESRTWRYEDIDNVSSSGPFQLTITTFERSKLDYGGLKQFNFQLKQRLEESRYNDLWLRLNQSKGLKVLSSYKQEAVGQ